MPDKHEKKTAGRFLRRYGILLLFCLIAAVFTLQTLGSPILLPFGWGITLDAPSAAYFSEDASLIIDRSGSRLLFLDKNEQVCRVQTFDSSSPLDFASGVIFHDGSFYVWGYKLAKDSGYTKYDMILRYDASGAQFDAVYEADRTQADAERCLILDVDTDGELLWVTEFLDDPHNYQDCGFGVFSRPLADTDAAPTTECEYHKLWVYAANYLPAQKSVYVSNQFGQLYFYSPTSSVTVEYAKEHYAKNLMPLPDGTVVWSESTTRDLYRDNALLIKDSNCYNHLSVDKNGFAYDDELNSCLHRVDLTDVSVETLSKVGFSFWFGIKTVLRFVSPIFLAAVLLIFVIVRSVKARKQKDSSVPRKGAMLLALFLIAGVISVFYTMQVVKTHEENRDEEITVMSRYFADTVDQGVLQDAVFRKGYLHDGEGYERWENAWGKLYYLYGDFRDREDPTAKAAYINFYQRVGDDFLCVFDSWTINPIGFKLVGTSATDERTDQIQVFQRDSESLIYKTTPIYNGNGELTGLLLLGMDYQLTRSQIFAKCLDMTLTLTILFVTAFLLFTEGKKLLEGLRKKKQMQLDGKQNTEIALIRPLFFFFNLTSSFDGVILVLVAKDMLSTAGLSDAAKLTLMAAPALVAGIGSIVGLPLGNVLTGKVPVRKLTVFSCVLCVVSFLGMSLSVRLGVFFLFCALKFCSSILNSVLYGIFAAIPLREKDEKARYELLSDSEMGRIASMILGPLLGGVVAQAFSNEAIYLLNAAAFLPVIALLLVCMPKKEKYIIRQKSLAAGKGFVNYIFSVPTLCYLLLLVIPAMTIGGYKNYLFPIYLSALDLPQIYITFFYVLALTVAMLLINPITQAIRGTDHWKRTVFTLALIGVCFLGFLINKTFYWAIIVLVINTVLEKLLKTSMTMLWPRQAEKHGLNLVSTSSLMSVFDQGAYAMKETVLSMFLLLGNNFACVAVGGFCILCATLFSALTHRSAMAKADNT